MIVPNHKNNYCIYNTYVLIIIKFCILIEKLCPTFKIFISELNNNHKIMSKVVRIIVFKNKDTLKYFFVIIIIYLFTVNYSYIYIYNYYSTVT